MEHWGLISVSLLRVTVFAPVTLLKMMILRTARDFYQPHGLEMRNLSQLSMESAIYCSSYVTRSIQTVCFNYQ